MNGPQPTRVPLGRFFDMESQLNDILLTVERPPVIIQMASDFVKSVAAGQSSLFSVVRTVDKPGGALSMTQIASISSQTNVMWRRGWICYRWSPSHRILPQSIRLKAFHWELFSKPFAFKTKLEARRKSDKCSEGNATYVNGAESVVTVFPQHPDVQAIFTEELVKAVETVNDNEKCSFEISFYNALHKWLRNFLLEATGENWSSIVRIWVVHTALAAA